MLSGAGAGQANWTAEPYRELYAHDAATTKNGADFNAMDTVNVAYTPAFGPKVAELHAQAVLFFYTLVPPTGGGGGGRNSTKLTKAECAAAGGVLDKKGRACCAASCGRCGGVGCPSLPGGKEKCCSSEVEAGDRVCSVKKAPCHA